MFGEIIKVLADEPEKIEKAILKAIKILFSILIASWLYKWIFGPYYLIRIADYDQLAGYFLSGRVIICLFFYFLSEYVIIQITESLGYLLAWIVSRKKMSLGRYDFSELLKLFDIVRFEKENKIPIPGRNIDMLYDFSKQFDGNEAKESVGALKRSFIGNVLGLYAVFILLYFVVISAELRNPALTSFVFAGLVIVLFIYYVIHGIMEYMLDNSREIISGISFIKTHDLILSTLRRYGILHMPGKGDLRKFKVFKHKEKDYVLILPSPPLKKITNDEISRMLIRKGRTGRIFILIIDQNDFAGDIQLLMLNHFDNLIPIVFNDGKNLEEQLKQTIESILK